MKMINASFTAGVFTCSLQDQQLEEYIQIKYLSTGLKKQFNIKGNKTKIYGSWILMYFLIYAVI